MIDILLKSDGSINEEEIAEYIKNHGINNPYENRDSKYNNMTPLYIAISSNEIGEDVKVKLVSYLINKGAKVGTTYALINISIYNQNFDLANLLLREGASVLRSGKMGNLIDIALALKNEQILQWVMKNARPLFWELNLPELSEYHQKFIATFPKYKDELSKGLKEIAHEKYSQHKFSRLGLINSEDAALILAAKMAKKSNNEEWNINSIFVITKDDIANLTNEIKKLIENETTKNIIKFQIIHFSDPHAIFGEFVIDKRNAPPTVEYEHFDPAPHITKYNEIITTDFINQLSPLANIKIYDSDVAIQKGIGCSYFSIDGATMLATPPDRDYVSNVIEYMKKHGEKYDNPISKEKNISLYNVTSLPTRFIRGLQFSFDEGPIKGLNTLVFSTEEKKVIVNKKGETAEFSIRKDLQALPSKSDPNIMVTFNKRAERKMKQYGEIVNNFIKDKDIIDPEFYPQIDKYKINGLTQFCDEQIEKKKENIIKL